MKSPFSSPLCRRLSKPFLGAALAACLLAALSFAPHASAQGVSLDVKFYDRSGAQIVTAPAGSTVKVVATVVVPDNAVGAKLTVDATAKLKLVGISLPYKIPMANVIAPNTNPQDGGTIVQSGTQEGEFKIPASTPSGSSIKVSAQATVAGLVSEVTKAKLSVH